MKSRLMVSIDDLGNGYNVWIDLIDPDHEELLGIAHKFNLDAEAIQTYFNKSKKPEIRLLDNQTFYRSTRYEK